MISAQQNFRRSLLASLLVGIGLASCNGGSAPGVDAVISLEHLTARLAQATIQVDYSETASRAATENGQVQCTFIDPRVNGSFLDDQNGRLTLKVQSSKGFAGPLDLAACHLIPKDPEADLAAVQAGVVVRIVKAQDETGKVIDPTVATAHRSSPSLAPGSAPPAEPALDKPGSTKSGNNATRAASPNTAGLAGAGAPPAKPTPTPVKPAAPADTAGAVPTAPAVPRATSEPKPTESAADRVRERIARNLPLGSKAGPAAPTPEPASDEGGAGEPEDDYDTSPRNDSSSPEYEVTVSVLSEKGPLGAFQIDLVHLGSSGSVVTNSGGGADCLYLGGVIGASNQVENSRSISIGLISLEGLPTPSEIVTCAFRSREPVTAGSFEVRVVDASYTGGGAVSPMPEAAVTSIVPR